MGTLGENKAPKFVRKPQLRQEDDGNRLIFECELSGHPKPDVSWYRQDEKISEDDRTVIKTTETQVGTFMVVLELDDVVESDAGLYKIKAKNPHGEVAASINLNFSRKFIFITITNDWEIEVHVNTWNFFLRYVGSKTNLKLKTKILVRFFS